MILKNTCITSSDGTIALLPGLESSISNLNKFLKKKREEINQQAQRIRSITSVLPTTLSISHAPIHTTSLSNVPIRNIILASTRNLNQLLSSLLRI